MTASTAFERLRQLWPMLVVVLGVGVAYVIGRRDFEHHRDIEGHEQMVEQFRELETRFERHESKWAERWAAIQKEAE